MYLGLTSARKIATSTVTARTGLVDAILGGEDQHAALQFVHPIVRMLESVSPLVAVSAKRWLMVQIAAFASALTTAVAMVFVAEMANALVMMGSLVMPARLLNVQTTALTMEFACQLLESVDAMVILQDLTVLIAPMDTKESTAMSHLVLMTALVKDCALLHSLVTATKVSPADSVKPAIVRPTALSTEIASTAFVVVGKVGRVPLVQFQFATAVTQHCLLEKSAQDTESVLGQIVVNATRVGMAMIAPSFTATTNAMEMENASLSTFVCVLLDGRDQLVLTVFALMIALVMVFVWVPIQRTLLTNILPFTMVKGTEIRNILCILLKPSSVTHRNTCCLLINW